MIGLDDLANNLILGSDEGRGNADLVTRNIFTIRTDGSNKIYLTDDGPGITNILASWSYDGSKIVYMRRESTSSVPYIWTMDADGSNKKQLTFGALSGNAATFSPDGKSILFTSYAESNGDPLVGLELWVINADGTGAHPITHTTVGAFSKEGAPLRWSMFGSYSPDGTRIAYASTQSGHSAIWVMNSDGSDKRQLTFIDDANSPDANSPVWSPDGSKIAYAGGFVGKGTSADSFTVNIFTIRPDGSAHTQLTLNSDGLSNDIPAWSPDGKYIYFQSIRNGPLETWVMRADGTDQRALFQGGYYPSRMPVTFGDGTLRDPAMPLLDAPNDLVGASDGSGSNLLASDGQAADFTFVSLLESDGNIFTITLDGAEKTYLTFDGNIDSLNWLPSWSSDGSKIVYTNVKSSDPPASGGVILPTGHIWTINADGSDQTQLTFGPIYGSLPSFSPDGKSILFTGFATGNPELWLMNSDGADPHPITHTTGIGLPWDGTTITWSTHGSFSPDGTKIAYSRTHGGHDEIWVMNVDGSEQTQVTFPDDPNAPDANNPNWSPDGSKITFCGGFAHGDGYIFTINPDGSDRTQLTFVRSDDPAWSPDSQQIIYDAVGSNGLAEAWIMAADGTNQRLLSPVPLTPSRVVAIEKVRTGTASGDPHFTTYDNVQYDYQGVGDFLLARSTVVGAQFEVQIRTRSLYDDASVTIISEAAATLCNHRVTFDIDRANGGGSFVWLDGSPVSLSVDNPAYTPGAGGLFEPSPEHYKVVWDTGEILEVTNNGTYLDLSTQLSWIDGPGSVEGLLASDFNPEAWRLTGATSLLDDVPTLLSAALADPTI